MAKSNNKKATSKKNVNKTPVNKYGLSRHIPKDVKLKVRQKCGFGCVICGCAIVDYEHLNPEFTECKEHNPDGIVLLCPGCHARKTRKFLPKEKIEKAILEPAAIKNGFSYDTLNLVDNYPEILFNGTRFIEVPIPISLKGESILEIRPPIEPNCPYLISAKFYNAFGNVVLEIKDNEWKTFPINWDIIVSGGKISIFDSLKQPCLVLNISNKDEVIIEYIRFRKGNILLEGNDKTLTFSDLNRKKNIVTFKGGKMEKCKVGINIE